MRHGLLAICTVEVVVEARNAARSGVHLLVEFVSIRRMLSHVLRLIQVSLTMITQRRLCTLSNHILKVRGQIIYQILIAINYLRYSGYL